MTELAKRRWLGLGAVGLAACLLAAVSLGNLGENLVYYWSPTQLVEKGPAAHGALVRLGGLVVPGSFDLASCNPGCSFRITDGRTEVDVRSAGLPPQMFREGIGVVVEGRLVDGVFETDRVLVKHSNEYRKDEAENPENWQRSLEGS